MPGGVAQDPPHARCGAILEEWDSPRPVTRRDLSWFCTTRRRRFGCIEALGRMRTLAARDALLDVLDLDDPLFRAAAVFQILADRPDAGSDLLLAAADEPEAARQRARALGALPSHGSVAVERVRAIVVMEEEEKQVRADFRSWEVGDVSVDVATGRIVEEERHAAIWCGVWSGTGPEERTHFQAEGEGRRRVGPR